ncbi:BCCT family transporter [Salinimonas sediminis]|uniref:BCCT family transporter n=1 Tax=Salinimonas sediminis TaxID=2303538 RepID=A0A346NPI6_9ALTE|nr:BCCT family transporter [Salinimonas sediminis]AXR07443.1 BCCT family transporter [Salinimonas sediminis]
MKTSTSVNRPVFYSSVLVAIVISVIAGIAPKTISAQLNATQTWLVGHFSWLYILAVAVFVLFCLFVMVSRLGDIKLGPDHAEPEYTYGSWLAMLFSAGMGIGLMFWGVSEPVMHYLSPPTGEAGTVSAAQQAVRITLFHWGLHAWAIYAVLALALAYFSFRHKLPLLPRSVLYPLIGDRIYGPLGHLTDTFAAVGTLFGVATGLGFGVEQISAGLSYVLDSPGTRDQQLLLIAVVVGCAMVSVGLGLDAGIKRLSNVNMVLSLILMIAVLLLGPTAFLLKTFVQNTGNYVSELLYSTFNLYAYDKKEAWLGGWTVFYWGFWIAWSPFVGTFIARISRGRTIREFTVGVLFVPTVINILWITLFGNSALQIIGLELDHPLAEAINSDIAISLYALFDYLPMTGILSVIAIVLGCTFFVTSADSGALVVDTLTSGGQVNTPLAQRLFWTGLIGVIAASQLYAGGLSALQTLVIVSAFPLIFILLLACYTLFKALRNDSLLQHNVQQHTGALQFSESNLDWTSRLDTLLDHPLHSRAQKFITQVAQPGLRALCEQLEQRGLNAELQVEPERVRMVIYKEGAENFAYGIRLREYAVPHFSSQYASGKYFRAEVFLHQGGQQYDVFGFTQKQIIADAISQYERHLHFLHLSKGENVNTGAVEES